MGTVNFKFNGLVHGTVKSTVKGTVNSLVNGTVNGTVMVQDTVMVQSRGIPDINGWLGIS